MIKKVLARVQEACAGHKPPLPLDPQNPVGWVGMVSPQNAQDVAEAIKGGYAHAGWTYTLYLDLSDAKTNQPISKATGLYMQVSVNAGREPGSKQIQMQLDSDSELGGRISRRPRQYWEFEINGCVKFLQHKLIINQWSRKANCTFQYTLIRENPFLRWLMTRAASIKKPGRMK